MINSGNYVLYIDSTYSIKIKSFDGEGGMHFEGRRYILDGIDTEFFILGVFIDNKRQDGFEFENTHPDTSYHTDNLFMKSIINDLGMTDLNMIPLNHFLQANKKVMFQVNKSLATAPIVDIYQGQSHLFVKNIAEYAYINKWVLPQYRHYNKFGGSGHSYSFDSRVFELMKINGVQSANTYFVGSFDAHRSWFDLDNPKLFAESVNDIPFPYPGGGFPVVANAGIVQFGDFYVKVTNSSTYPYGKFIMLFKDIRTNEIWLLLSYLQLGTGVQMTTLFDINTLKSVAGGFEIESVAHNLKVQISNIYG